MQKGDIVLIPFPFTDLSGKTNRPALVLVDGEMDLTLAFISTQLKWKDETDIVLKPSVRNGLKKESLIRLSKIATIDKLLAIGLLRKTDSKVMKQINNNLIKLFKLNE
jgi:mRNA interferase MazF